MKISKQTLAKIKDLASANFRNDSNGELSADEFISACWVRAVMGELAKEIELEFPQRNNTESVFED